MVRVLVVNLVNYIQFSSKLLISLAECSVTLGWPLGPESAKLELLATTRRPPQANNVPDKQNCWLSQPDCFLRER